MPERYEQTIQQSYKTKTAAALHQTERGREKSKTKTRIRARVTGGGNFSQPSEQDGFFVSAMSAEKFRKNKFKTCPQEDRTEFFQPEK